MLYDKWWKLPGLTCVRDELTKKEGKAAALGADNIGGVFVVLLFGLALAVFTAMFEFFWHSRKLAKNSRVSEFLNFIFIHLLTLFKFVIFSYHIVPKWQKNSSLLSSVEPQLGDLCSNEGVLLVSRTKDCLILHLGPLYLVPVHLITLNAIHHPLIFICIVASRLEHLP